MPLQKSFSEQSRFSKPRRGQWKRSNTHSGSIAPKPQPTKPPITVSAKTKTKLQQFQFQDSERAKSPTLPSPEKEAGGRNADGQADDDQANKAKKVLCQAPNGAAVTPASRLAWQDLMGSEDPEKQHKNTSPDERLEWEDEMVEAASPLVPRRGKKRARSSSPMSSPALDKMRTPAVNLKQLKQALGSPRVDPALDLWNRFAVGPLDNSLGATNPALAHLMVSSSPRPSKDSTPTHVESGLRRAISCGSHWPKRRRVESASKPQPVKQRGETSKSSMVTALLETVNSEINKPDDLEEMQEEESGIESSPSIMDRRKPTQTPDPPQPAIAQRFPETDVSVQSADAKSVHIVEQAETTNSDYGDDYFDDDTMLELDASMLSGQVGAGSFTAAERVLTTGTVKPPQQKPELLCEDKFNDEFEDEFDDLDNDLLVAAAENMSTEITPKPNAEVVSRTVTTGTRLDGSMDGSDDTFEDDFGGDLDFEAIELAATQSVMQKASSLMPVSRKRAAIQRYLVMNALPNTFTDDRGRDAPEMILIVQAERSQKTNTVHLRGDWADTPAHAKSFVHIIGDFEPSGRCIIDNSQNILVLHPDQLISATVVADSFTCMRRAVLQDRVKATSEASAPLVYGTLLHEIFQEALMSNKWDQSFLNEVIERTMKKHVQDLYSIKVNFTDAREHMASKMPEVRGWAERFISSFPRPDAVAQGRNNEKINVCVSKLLDIEEHVWSPLYGLKGNIDATIQVTVQNAQEKRTLTVPFEVKTGKNVSENHQAQTMLYNLLLTDRYDIEIVYGILYYMETSLTKIIPAVRNELRHMIKQRNQLAVYIRERSVQLPPMKKSKHMCGKCYAQTSCFVYHKLADDGDGDSSGVKEKFDEIVKHLTPTHKEFFLKWEDLLTKEEKESQKLRRELWTMLSFEREKVGRCFGNVIIEEGSAHEDLHIQKVNRFNYNFIKENTAPGFSFMDSQLGIGEPIVISDEQGHFALAIGYVTSVRKQRISVAVDRRLHNARIKQPGFNEHNNQVYASIMEVVPEGVRPEDSQGKIKEPPIKYRLDKDEFSNGMALVRNNIVSIMGNSQLGFEKIRRLVVDLQAPEFKSIATQYTISDKDTLNTDQKKAIEKVMSAKDYALVLGMPGTGKTTTIAHIIRALIAQRKSVLLTSYTHTAVDNILLKLKTDDIPILRLGAPAKVHPEVQDFAILAGQPMDTFEEIRSSWHDTPVVATTCLGTSHGIFNERTFDYCIVDEASQITLPICLGPIRMARTFVLVGDHNQLPPLVQNEEARLGGLDVSLFKLLSDTHPDSVVNLEHQYRMSEDIMTLSNTLIYEGRLKCGTEELRFRKLDIPNIDALQKHHFDVDSILSQPSATPNTFCMGIGPCWLRDVVDPETRVRFIDTDRLPSSRETSKGSRIVNPCEARIVSQLVDALLTVGVPASEIGVMTHYRSQLSLLKHGLRGHGNGAIEMHTADRFQGRDKEVVILSLVRSNDQCSIGDLLKDWRRINVAFTRAKTKLLVIGSKSTLKGSGCEEMLARFIGLMEARCWIYDLHSDALDGHIFEDAGTQITATGRRGSAGNGSSPRKQVMKMKTPKKRVLGAQGNAKTDASLRSKTQFLGGGKENGDGQSFSVKRARANPEVLLKGKPNVAGILNDMMGGIF